MHQIGHFTNQVSLAIVEAANLTMQLFLLDINLMMFGLLGTPGEPAGVNKDILDLHLEIHVDCKIMLLLAILLDLTTLSTFIYL
jgi:hypothetical protein